MNKRLFFVVLGLSLVSFIVMLTLYPSLPRLVPISWGLDGQINGWGHKLNLLVPGAVAPLTALGIHLLPKIDPRRNYQKFEKAYTIFGTFIPVVFIALAWASYLPGFGLRLPVGFIINVLMGALLLVLGNYMPQLRSGYFMGFRTPWALENETVWRKTHRFAGMLFFVVGLLFILCAFVPALYGVTMGVLLGGCVGVYVYSYVIYKRLKTNSHREDEDHAKHQ